MIKQLKEEGYEVEAVRNRGYRLSSLPDILSREEIVSQVKKILYFNENRDVLILVDLGSLENITELLDDLPNVNLGIINNVSTAMALSVGSHILDGMPLAEVLENAKNASQIRYKILEKARKEDVILFVSESGSNVAAKVSELFMHSQIGRAHV